jgi:hypothetical protein
VPGKGRRNAKKLSQPRAGKENAGEIVSPASRLISSGFDYLVAGAAVPGVAVPGVAVPGVVEASGAASGIFAPGAVAPLPTSGGKNDEASCILGANPFGAGRSGLVAPPPHPVKTKAQIGTQHNRHFKTIFIVTPNSLYGVKALVVGVLSKIPAG